MPSKQEPFHVACVIPGTTSLARGQGPTCQRDWKLLQSCHRPNAERVPQTKARRRAQQLAREGPICSTILSCGRARAPACRTAVSPGAVGSLFSPFYYFSGNSNQGNRAGCTG